MRRDWKTEKKTGRELLEKWIDEDNEAQGSIAEAARILGLGEAGRQRLWAYLRVGTGLGPKDGLRVAVISGLPYRAIVNGDDRICDLFDPKLAERYTGPPQI